MIYQCCVTVSQLMQPEDLRRQPWPTAASFMDKISQRKVSDYINLCINIALSLFWYLLNMANTAT